LRIIVSVLEPNPIFFWWGIIFMILGLISAIFSAIQATLARDIKRILAFSSIENIGLIFIMIASFLFGIYFEMDNLVNTAIVAIAMHSIAHAIFKSGLFLGTGIIGHSTHTRRIDALGGLARPMKSFSIAMLILCLAASALPPFGAFISEWLLLQGFVVSIGQAPMIFRLIIALAISGVAITGGLAIFAMVRFFGMIFLAEPRSEAAAKAKKPSALMNVPVIILATLITFMGIFGSNIFSFISGQPQKNLDIKSVIIVGNSSLFATLLAFVMAGLLISVVLLRRLFSDQKKERLYHTWDCGQPINASMEYTGSAFSAPIRFFIKAFTHTYKHISSKAAIPSNPWIKIYSAYLIRPKITRQYVYEPLKDGILFISRKVSKIQNGIVQFYIGLIFITLLITILIAF
jgi:hydrogenase-4 component B